VAATEAKIETVIRPTHGWAGFNLRELWEYRELLLFFTWRTVLVRYKQTLLGATWAVLQPFFMMVIFSIFFGRIAGISTADIPAPLFYYSALVPWFFFANSLNASSNSLVGNANLLRKIYFPRFVLPLAGVLAALVDFLIAFTILVVMMVVYGYYPRWEAVFVLPAVLLLAVACALGVGLVFSAANVAYRDVQYVIPFVAQAWLFATPAVYAGADLLEEPWRTVVGLNPMNGVIETFRWALLNAGPAPGGMVVVSAVVSAVLVVVGAAYFRRQERTFADVV
jgi:lipopolysaccharide transport system permease protein